MPEVFELLKRRVRLVAVWARRLDHDLCGGTADRGHVKQTGRRRDTPSEVPHRRTAEVGRDIIDIQHGTIVRTQTKPVTIRRLGESIANVGTDERRIDDDLCDIVFEVDADVYLGLDVAVK